ncbi:hypothetical protein [Pseudomonas taetrolens]|uniref:hypothetical protein n=1 Tax=Pseudomonas taetrolens TaxID=47884 RepID=UPI003F950E5A
MTGKEREAFAAQAQADARELQEVAVPPWAAAGLRKSDSLELKVRALLAECRQRTGYERQLVAAERACQ